MKGKRENDGVHFDPSNATLEDFELAAAVEYIRLNCCPPGATHADAIRFAVFHTAATRHRLGQIAGEEAPEGATVN